MPHKARAALGLATAPALRAHQPAIAPWHMFPPLLQYIGFEVVSTAAEEARNPARDVPIATVATVGLCGTFYLLMSLAITGMVPYLQVRGGQPCCLVL